MKYTFEKSLGRITQQVSKGLGRVLETKFREAGYKITSGQWTVISFLNQNERATQKEIVKFMGVNKVMVKRIVDQLENQKFVRRIRSSDDKRYNEVELTKNGRLLYSKLTPFAEQTLKEAYADLNIREIEHCIKTLDRIADKLETLQRDKEFN